MEKCICLDSILDRRDSSGIRFYLSNERRQYDIGYLVLGTDVSLLSLAIPPRVDQFMIDSYCSSTATRVCCSSSQM